MSTNINWLEEAKKYEDDLLTDLQGWIQIPSVKEPTTDLKEYPVGKENRHALDYFLNLGAKNNFETKNIDNIAGHLEMGAGEALIGILGHSDVVPVGDGWTKQPFGGEIEDGFMYGRGTQDDKGPMMASFYALKMIRDLNLPLSKRIRLINGTDEESGFTCMERYFKTEEMPELGFSPDANFPLIYGEKGMVNFNIVVEDQYNELVSFEAGQRMNMVPDFAKAVVATDTDLEATFNAYLTEHNIVGSYAKDGNNQVLVMEGQAVHGMQPELGTNAAYLLGEFLATTSIQSNFVDALNTLLVGDTAGEKLGVAHTGEMGGLTANAGVFTTDGRTFKITINLRHSQEWDQDAGQSQIKKALTSAGASFELIDIKTPLYVSPEDPFIKTLSGVYQKQTGDTQTPLLTTGGGTYASVMKKGVAYGMLFNGTEDRMHQNDERVPVEDLVKAVAIYAEAIYELAK